MSELSQRGLLGIATVELLGITGGRGGGGGGCQVGSKIEISYGYVRHSCSIDYMMKSQAK